MRSSFPFPPFSPSLLSLPLVSLPFSVPFPSPLPSLPFSVLFSPPFPSPSLLSSSSSPSFLLLLSLLLSSIFLLIFHCWKFPCMDTMYFEQIYFSFPPLQPLPIFPPLSVPTFCFSFLFLTPLNLLSASCMFVGVSHLMEHRFLLMSHIPKENWLSFSHQPSVDNSFSAGCGTSWVLSGSCWDCDSLNYVQVLWRQWQPLWVHVCDGSVMSSK